MEERFTKAWIGGASSNELASIIFKKKRYARAELAEYAFKLGIIYSYHKEAIEENNADRKKMLGAINEFLYKNEMKSFNRVEAEERGLFKVRDMDVVISVEL